MRGIFDFGREEDSGNSVEMNDGFGVVVEPLEGRLLLSGTHYVVDSLLDVVADDGVVTLREAIEAANTNTAVTGDVVAGSENEKDTISFVDGLFDNGAIELGGSSLLITESLDIIGQGADVTVIDAMRASRVMMISSEQACVTLQGIGLTGGIANMGGVENTVFEEHYSAEDNSGGGIYIEAQDVVIRDCKIWNNTVLCDGGGVYNYRGTLTLSGTAVSDNSSLHHRDRHTDPILSRGGGISHNYGELTISGCVISNNFASEYGGGIYSSDKFTVTDSRIVNNTAEYGGGAWFHYHDTAIFSRSEITGNSAHFYGGGLGSQGHWPNNLNVTDSLIADNYARVYGGGMYFYNGIDVELNYNVLKDNTAGKDGGGVMLVYVRNGILKGNTFTGNAAALSGGGGGYFENCEKLTITHNEFSKNTSNRGGGCYFADSYAFVSGNLFIANQATLEGGGIYKSSAYDIVNIENSTFVENQAETGGGFYGHGPTYIIASEFRRNHASEQGGGVYATGSNEYMSISASEFNGNSAEGQGGGLFATYTKGMDVINSTFVGNQAIGSAGGIYATEGNMTITNSAIVGNSAARYSGVLNSRGTVVEMSNSIAVFNANDEDVSAGVSVDGYCLVGIDPQFVRQPSAGVDGEWGTEDDDYGDMRLQAGSIAIDAGIDGEGAPQTDMLGRGRWDDVNVEDTGSGEITYIDIGAYEAHYPVPVISGDFNGDDSVGMLDLDILGLNWGMRGATKADGDANGDGMVSLLDLDILGRTWGMGAMGSRSQGILYDQDRTNEFDWWEIELEEEEVVLF